MNASALQLGDVAGAQPSVVGEPLRAARVPVVGARDPRATDLQLAARVGVDPELDQRQDAALAARRRVASSSRARRPAGRPRDGGERAGLGHSPALDHGHAEALLEGADQGLGHRGATRLQLSHAGRDRAAGSSSSKPFQIVGTPALQVTPSEAIRSASPRGAEVGAGEDLPAPGHRRDVRDSPPHRVEHRHDGHHGVGLANAHRVGKRRAEGVEHDRALRVQDPLRPPRGAARVADGRRGVLVEVGELERRVAARHELLVVERPLALARAVGHQDLALHCPRTAASGPPGRRRGRSGGRPRARRCSGGPARTAGCSACGGPRPCSGPRDRAPGGGASSRRSLRRGLPADAQLGERAGQPPGPLDDPAVGRALDSRLGPRDDLAVTRRPPPPALRSA